MLTTREDLELFVVRAFRKGWTTCTALFFASTESTALRTRV